MPFSPGEVVLKCKPFVYCISTQWRPSICDFCLNSQLLFKDEGPDEMMKCDECQCVYFCQKSCQEKAWEEYHREECQFLRKFRNPNDVDEMVRMVARALIKLKKGTEFIYEELPNGEKVHFEDLVSHRQGLMADEGSYLAALKFYKSLRLFMGDKLTLTIKEVAELLFKFVSNDLPLVAIGFGKIGQGLFLSINTSTIKHSCSQNVMYRFNGKEMTLGAIANIESFSDVRMAYTPNYHEDTKSRRKYLEERYFFTCHCSLCDDEKLGPAESSMYCPKCEGGCIPISQLVCQDCNFKATRRMLEKYQEIKAKLVLPETLNFVRTSQPDSTLANLEKYEEWFIEALDVIHPLDCSFYKLRRMAKFSICGSFEATSDSRFNFDDATERNLILLLKIAQHSVIACRARLAPFHTDIALNEYDVAFLYAYLGEIDKANEAFKRYLDIMTECFKKREDLPLCYIETEMRMVQFESAKMKEDLSDLFQNLSTME